tara:strand:- start:3756 stop:5294 length:1539 start_codon:yes stop_codon:yes gene_type:complete
MPGKTKKELVEEFLKKGVLLTPDYLKDMESKKDIEHIPKDMLIMDKKLSSTRLTKNINWKDLDRSMVNKDKGSGNKQYAKFLDYLDEQGLEAQKKVKIIFSYKDKEKKPTLQDFVGYFNSRFSTMEPLIGHHSEIKKLLTINKLKNKKDREIVSIIGIVEEIYITKNRNILLTIEDPSGTFKVLINQNKPELIKIGKNIVLDQIIGITGAVSENIIFANSIIEPDIPLTKSFKKAPLESYAIFLSDIHVGSTYFLEEEFKKFLKWINQQSGSEKQKQIASKVEYIFIIGDLVDGVGIYPNQEKELSIKDIHEQYVECAKLLDQIPKHIKIIICPGNHDAVRLSEPQPVLSKEYASPLWELENVIMVSNPSSVLIHESEDFPGFEVLMYHGYSFDYYVAQIDSIRNSGGYDRPDLIMKFLLKKRHLAPSHTSTLYVADSEKDNLVIDRIPDFFVTGHIHKSSVSQHRNITLICGSCFQSTTSFQEKLGHKPEPCRVPVVNLKTRKVNVLRFGD